MRTTRVESSGDRNIAIVDSEREDMTYEYHYVGEDFRIYGQQIIEGDDETVAIGIRKLHQWLLNIPVKVTIPDVVLARLVDKLCDDTFQIANPTLILDFIATLCQRDSSYIYTFFWKYGEGQEKKKLFMKLMEILNYESPVIKGMDSIITIFSAAASVTRACRNGLIGDGYVETLLKRLWGFASGDANPQQDSDTYLMLTGLETLVKSPSMKITEQSHESLFHIIPCMLDLIGEEKVKNLTLKKAFSVLHYTVSKFECEECIVSTENLTKWGTICRIACSLLGHEDANFRNIVASFMSNLTWNSPEICVSLASCGIFGIFKEIPESEVDNELWGEMMRISGNIIVEKGSYGKFIDSGFIDSIMNRLDGCGDFNSKMETWKFFQFVFDDNNNNASTAELVELIKEKELVDAFCDILHSLIGDGTDEDIYGCIFIICRMIEVCKSEYDPSELLEALRKDETMELFENLVSESREKEIGECAGKIRTMLAEIFKEDDP